MTSPDFNLLLTLDVLLAEGSVARAARRLRLSPSAMSRALARLRETTGDPLLVRAGRGLVPTPRALELRERIGPLVQEAEAVELVRVELGDLVGAPEIPVGRRSPAQAGGQTASRAEDARRRRRAGVPRVGEVLRGESDAVLEHRGLLGVDVPVGLAVGCLLLGAGAEDVCRGGPADQERGREEPASGGTESKTGGHVKKSIEVAPF